MCGGILFFQGWRLDPILQFGQFLLAGTTVFFAYESVRLRGIATDQARRSSYFDDDPISDIPRNSRGRFNDDYERFEEVPRTSRRFKPQEDEFEDDYIEGRSNRRNVSRAIAPSSVTRRRPSSREVNKFDNSESKRRRQTFEDRNSDVPVRNNFGERRVSTNEIKTGSRPRRNQTVSRQENISSSGDSSPNRKQSTRSSIRQQSAKQEVEDASFQDSNNPIKKSRETRRVRSSGRSSTKSQNISSRYTVGTNKKKPRDNSSRFDD